MTKRHEIHPKVGEVFYLQAEVVHVRFRGGKEPAIIIRLRERFSGSEFNLVYKQQQLFEEDNMQTF